MPGFSMLFPQMTEALHPHTLRGLHETFRFQEATKVQAKAQPLIFYWKTFGELGDEAKTSKTVKVF